MSTTNTIRAGEVDGSGASLGSVRVQVDDHESHVLELAERELAAICSPADLHDAITTAVTTASGPDPVELVRLAAKIRNARRLVGGAEHAMRDRVARSAGVQVHPETLRKAAAVVLDARADVVTAEAEFRDALAEDAALDGAEQFSAERDDLWGDEDERDADRRVIRWVTVVFVLCLLAGGAVFAAGGGPLGLAVAGVALVFELVVLFRHRRRTGGPVESGTDDQAAASLANALSNMDAGALPIAESEEQARARAQLTMAENALRFATKHWEGLVGPGIPVEDLEDEILRRDPQAYAVSDEAVAMSPSVRAASSMLRRLEAKWKRLYWELDAEPPDIDDPGVLPVVVCHDPESVIDDAALAQLPPAVRVVVVQPA